jgi:MFS family permease
VVSGVAQAPPSTRLRDHPDAFRLAVSNVVDGLGTYVGLAALLVVGYESTQLLGTALVLAGHILPGLLVTLFVAPRLQHRNRRGVLLVATLLGVVALLPAIIAPNGVTAVIAAALLGATGVATRGVQMAALAEALPHEVRGRFYGLVGSFGQGVQVVGLATGGAIATALSARTALLIDAVSFVAAAAVIATIAFPPPARADRGSEPAVFGRALSVVWTVPILRVMAIVTWIGALVSAVPEAASPAVTSGSLLPVVMAAAPAGGVVGALVCTRLGVFSRVDDSLRLALVSAGSLVVLGAGMQLAFQRPPDSFGRAVYGIVANALIGVLGVWYLGMITAFTAETPPSDTVGVGAFMSWSVGAASGLGGFVVASLDVPGGYAALGLLLLPAAVWALRVVRTRLAPLPG